MKSMTCKELGGACDMIFTADTFEEIAQLSKMHGTEMMEKKDPPHLKAMEVLMGTMKSPEAFQKWYAEKKQEFEALPSN